MKNKIVINFFVQMTILSHNLARFTKPAKSNKNLGYLNKKFKFETWTKSCLLTAAFDFIESKDKCFRSFGLSVELIDFPKKAETLSTTFDKSDFISSKVMNKTLGRWRWFQYPKTCWSCKLKFLIEVFNWSFKLKCLIEVFNWSF